MRQIIAATQGTLHMTTVFYKADASWSNTLKLQRAIVRVLYGTCASQDGQTHYSYPTSDSVLLRFTSSLLCCNVPRCALHMHFVGCYAALYHIALCTCSTLHCNPPYMMKCMEMICIGGAQQCTAMHFSISSRILAVHCDGFSALHCAEMHYL